MKKIILMLLMVFLLTARPIFGISCETERCADCDLCGYCWKAGAVPATWEKCRECLYPGIQAPATENQTLRINADTNIAPTPNLGRSYTMIGCIITTGGFDQPGGAGGFIDKILQIIFSASGGIAFLYLIYGTFLIMTSQSDFERLNHGKKVVTGAIIGLIVTLSIVFIIRLITANILKIPEFGG